MDDMERHYLACMKSVAKNLAHASDTSLYALMKVLDEDGIDVVVAIHERYKEVIADLAITTIASELMARHNKRKEASTLTRR